MQKDLIEFTDHKIDREVLTNSRRWLRSFPKSWHRREFILPNQALFEPAKFDNWLRDAIEGRWGHWSYHDSDFHIHVVVYFELDTDAVTFVLEDGHEAFLKSDKNS